RFKPDFARTLRPGWLTVPVKSAVVFRRVEFNEYLVRAFSYFGGSVKTELIDSQNAAKEGIDGMTFIYSL
uniref:hypothetical protein n=1 Tax=uncultured Escherichia sp. TaxID=237777 RepID=UPI0025A951FA